MVIVARTRFLIGGVSRAELAGVIHSGGRGGVLGPLLAVEGAPAGLWRAPTPLLEEEGDTFSGAEIAKVEEPATGLGLGLRLAADHLDEGAPLRAS